MRLTAAAILTLAGSLAHAQVAYNNLGPGDSYNGGTSYILFGTQAPSGIRTQAFQFVSLATGGITNLVVPMQHSTAGNTFTFEIFTDAGGVPGSSLGVIGQVAGFPPNTVPLPPPIQIAADGSILITSGTTYWLVGQGSGTSQGGLHANSQGVNGLRAYIAPFSPNWTIDTQPLAAFRIEVNGTSHPCYANCDNSTASPLLNANDFQCFLNKFAAGCT